MPDHDALYHRLFSHSGMVAQLLREFVAGPWLDDLDLDGMERMNASPDFSHCRGMMAKVIVVPRGFRAAANTGLYWQGAKTPWRGKNRASTRESVRSPG
jgi:hypothetical protein